MKKFGKVVLLLTFLLLYIAGGEATSSKRHTKRAESKFEEWQKRSLEKIQLLAREGGLPEEEWRGITKFDKDVCYEMDCLKSGKYTGWRFNGQQIPKIIWYITSPCLNVS